MRLLREGGLRKKRRWPMPDSKEVSLFNGWEERNEHNGRQKRSYQRGRRESRTCKMEAKERVCFKRME